MTVYDLLNFRIQKKKKKKKKENKRTSKDKNGSTITNT